MIPVAIINFGTLCNTSCLHISIFLLEICKTGRDETGRDGTKVVVPRPVRDTGRDGTGRDETGPPTGREEKFRPVLISGRERIFRDRANPLEDLPAVEVYKRYRFDPDSVVYITGLLYD